jgi:hypothetical protein
LIGLLVLIAGISLLQRPLPRRGVFDLLLGMPLGAACGGLYSLMTDDYPPSRLDMSASEPSAFAVTPTSFRPVAAGAGGRLPHRQWRRAATARRWGARRTGG